MLFLNFFDPKNTVTITAERDKPLIKMLIIGVNSIFILAITIAETKKITQIINEILSIFCPLSKRYIPKKVEIIIAKGPPNNLR